MTEYVLAFFVLLFGTLSIYLLYEKFIRSRRRVEDVTYSQALADLLDGRQEAAFSKLRQVVSDDAGNIDAYLRLGQILRDYGQPEKALQIHKDLTLRVGLASKYKTAILKQLALDYLALEDHGTAERAVREIINKDSKNRWAHTALLNIQEKSQQWQNAYETASNLMRLEGNKSNKPLAKYKFQMAKQLFDRREYHKCRLLCKETISIDPGYVDAYLLVGDSYAIEDRSDDAVVFWQKLIAAVPEEAHKALDRLKKTLFDLGRFGEIVRICEDILEKDPKNQAVRLALTEIYEKKGDLGSAIEQLEKLIEICPESQLPRLVLVRLFLEKGSVDKATEVLQSLLIGLSENPTRSSSSERSKSTALTS